MDYKQLLLGVGVIGLLGFGAYAYFQPSAEENMYGSSGEHMEEMEEIENDDVDEVEETDDVETGMAVPGAESVDEMIVKSDSIDTTSDVQTYTLADVAEHASEDSCWTAVEGKVYDLTPALDTHPGGKKNIMKICGIDGTSAFMGKHGNDDRPQESITNRYIGDLVE